MTARTSDEKGVYPSVEHVHCDKTQERSVQIIIPYQRSFSLVFWEEDWLMGGDKFLPEILGKTDHVGAKLPIFSR